MNRVLIVKMWALGDILMATPMLAALRARHPGIQITWLVDQFHAGLLEGHPEIDELIALDSGRWRRRLRRGDLAGWLAESRRLRADMRARRFDAVINCHPDKWWTAVLCAAPRRVGLYPSERLPGSRALYTQALNRPRRPPLHNTDHYLLATRALGCPDAGKQMTLGRTPGEAVFIEGFCREQGILDGRPLVVLAPFSTGENRCWEPDRFAALAEGLAETHKARIVMTLGPGDEARAQEIVDRAARARIVAAAGTTLRQYIALLRRADLVVCGDSSPMHIAAAVGTPYLALFGPTPVGERAPLAGAGRALARPLPCAPCDRPGCTHPTFRQCMKLLATEEVQAAADQLLGAPRKELSTPL